MIKRYFLPSVILIGLAACSSVPEAPTRTNTAPKVEAINSAPDLSELDRDTRQSIETACVGEFTQGPAPYRECVARQLDTIKGTEEGPDLSSLDRETRQSIEIACVGEFTQGPALYRQCVDRQLESIGVNSDTLLPSDIENDVPQSPTSEGAESVWEFSIEASGTPFEKRWANADPLTDESSADAMLGFAGISADEGNLELYIGDPYPLADVLISALSGEEMECDFTNWRLAVDRQEFVVADTTRSTDNSATFLQPKNVEAFWQAFVDGVLLAVEFERICGGDMTVVTMVYSLSG